VLGGLGLHDSGRRERLLRAEILRLRADREDRAESVPVRRRQAADAAVRIAGDQLPSASHVRLAVQPLLSERRVPGGRRVLRSRRRLTPRIRPQDASTRSGRLAGRRRRHGGVWGQRRSRPLQACAPQKLGARQANAKGWTCQTAAAEYRSVIDLLRNVVAAIQRVFAPHAIVAAENLLLRHQLIVLRRSSPRPRLQRLDQIGPSFQ
jgi:hypothetical protein